MIKIFTYFVEPASYTLDLIKNIHNKLDIKYAFMNHNSEVSPNSLCEKSEYLSKKFILDRMIFLYQTWKENELVIINGYNNYIFIINFIINFLSFKKRFLAIESDTQLKIPENVIKRIIKNIYLNIIFRNKYVLGFAGGSVTHKDLFRYYGMKEERIFMIPMMVDNNKYYQESKSFPEIFTFLFVGRLLSTKNVDKLCECFISSFSDKESQLLIVGDGKNFDQYKTRYLNKSIHFKGSLYDTELIRAYHDSSVFVFPSSKESWGLVINEAMSSSLPIIAYKEVGSIYDLVLDKETGFIIEDFDELKDRMMQMYEDRDLCHRYSRNAVEIMRKYWNYSLYEDNLLESIDQVEKWKLKR